MVAPRLAPRLYKDDITLFHVGSAPQVSAEQLVVVLSSTREFVRDWDDGSTSRSRQPSPASSARMPGWGTELAPCQWALPPVISRLACELAGVARARRWSMAAWAQPVAARFASAACLWTGIAAATCSQLPAWRLGLCGLACSPGLVRDLRALRTEAVQVIWRAAAWRFQHSLGLSLVAASRRWDPAARAPVEPVLGVVRGLQEGWLSRERVRLKQWAPPWRSSQCGSPRTALAGAGHRLGAGGAHD